MVTPAAAPLREICMLSPADLGMTDADYCALFTSSANGFPYREIMPAVAENMETLREAWEQVLGLADETMGAESDPSGDTR